MVGRWWGDGEVGERGWLGRCFEQSVTGRCAKKAENEIIWARVLQPSCEVREISYPS